MYKFSYFSQAGDTADNITPVVRVIVTSLTADKDQDQTEILPPQELRGWVAANIELINE